MTFKLYATGQQHEPMQSTIRDSQWTRRKCPNSFCIANKRGFPVWQRAQSSSAIQFCESDLIKLQVLFDHLHEVSFLNAFANSFSVPGSSWEQTAARRFCSSPSESSESATCFRFGLSSFFDDDCGTVFFKLVKDGSTGTAAERSSLTPSEVELVADASEAGEKFQTFNWISKYSDRYFSSASSASSCSRLRFLTTNPSSSNRGRFDSLRCPINMIWEYVMWLNIWQDQEQTCRWRQWLSTWRLWNRIFR